MKKVIIGYNDLETENPKLAKEWHPTKNGDLKPENVTSGSNRNVWWLGDCGHEWKAVIGTRVRANSGCPYCANRKVLVGFNDLVTRNPEIAKEWHPTKNGDLRPEDFVSGSNIKVWWKCHICGSEWKAQINQRVQNGSTCCPACARTKSYITKHNNKIESGKTLSNMFPEIALDWDYEKNGNLSPDDVTPADHRIVWWKCRRCGFSWKAKIANRTCPKCKRSYLASVSHRTIDKTGCPYCSKQKVVSGVTDLEIWCLYNHQDKLLKEWDYEKNVGISPRTVFKGSNSKVWWKCSVCGHEWEAALYSRTGKKKNGCPRCREENRKTLHSKKVINLNTGEIYNSIREAAKNYGRSPQTISCCLSGKTSTAFGYHWDYYVEGNDYSQNDWYLQQPQEDKKKK